jgi:hypothetical protein
MAMLRLPKLVAVMSKIYVVYLTDCHHFCVTSSWALNPVNMLRLLIRVFHEAKAISLAIWGQTCSSFSLKSFYTVFFTCCWYWSVSFHYCSHWIFEDQNRPVSVSNLQLYWTQDVVLHHFASCILVSFFSYLFYLE